MHSTSFAFVLVFVVAIQIKIGLLAVYNDETSPFKLNNKSNFIKMLTSANLDRSNYDISKISFFPNWGILNAKIYLYYVLDDDRIVPLNKELQIDWPTKRWYGSSRSAPQPGSAAVKLSSYDDRELEFCANCLLNYGINVNSHSHNNHHNNNNNNNECYYCYAKYIFSVVDNHHRKPASKYWFARAG